MRTKVFHLRRRKHGVCSLLLTTVLAAIFFSSCSSECGVEEDYLKQQSQKEKSITLSLEFSVSSGMQTRGGRELWSREPLQQVNNLKLWVFRGTGDNAEFVKTMKLPQFYTDSPISDEKKTIRMEATLPEGIYTFLAIGMENPSDNYSTYSFPSTSNLTLGEMILTLEEERADEIFVGICEKPIEISGETDIITGDITLNRVTAGIVGYFTHVPYYINVIANNGNSTLKRVYTVKLLASARGRQCSLLPSTKFTHIESDANETELLSFDLSSFEKDADNNWYIIPQDDWRAEGLKESPNGVKKVPDSILGGRFLLPFPAREGATLRVVLYDEEGEEIYSYLVVDTTAGVRTPRFPILANHYYGLGVKYTDTGENPNMPENPDTPEVPFEEDKPIDLSKALTGAALEITVIGAWQSIVDIEIN